MLSVDVLVAVEEGVDLVLGDRDRFAELAGDVHGANDIRACGGLLCLETFLSVYPSTTNLSFGIQISY